MIVHAHDPIADTAETMQEYGVSLVSWADLPKCDVVALAVTHEQILQRGAMEILEKVVDGGCIVEFEAADFAARPFLLPAVTGRPADGT